MELLKNNKVLDEAVYLDADEEYEYALALEMEEYRYQLAYEEEYAKYCEEQYLKEQEQNKEEK